MDGDEIQKAFEAKHEKFLAEALKTEAVESVMVSTVLRPGEVPAGYPKPLEERVDSLSRNAGPMNGKEAPTKVTAWEEGLVALDKMAKSREVKIVQDFESPDLEIRFKFHAADAAKQERHRDVRQKCWALAEFICKECPPSRELSIALTKVEEVMLWANAAIARRG
jgi:hypothetical protein